MNRKSARVAQLSDRGRMSLSLLVTMLSIFVALPAGLPVLGVGQADSLVLAILAVGSLADIFTTRLGFRLGGMEVNPLYSLAKSMLSPNQFSFVMAFTKIGIGVGLVIFFPNHYVLLLIALYSLSGVMFNSLSLAFASLNSADPQDKHIE